MGQRILRPLQQALLQKQVAAGVARQAQLGQAQHLYALLRRLTHQRQALLRVVGAVGHPNLRGTGGHLDKSVPHGRLLSFALCGRLHVQFLGHVGQIVGLQRLHLPRIKGGGHGGVHGQTG